MKISVIKTKNMVKYFILVLMLGVLTQCAEEIDEWEPVSEDQVITEFIEDKPEMFSEFAGMIDTTGVRNLLRVRGPFTLLLPTDSAMRVFYKEKGVSSYKELPLDYVEELVYNHIFTTLISKDDIGIGALPVKNAADNFVSSDRSGSQIILNKEVKIIDLEIKTSNGIVHYIDKVLDVINESAVDVMADLPQFSIFYEGLQKTKLIDTLKTISFLYGEYNIRTYFTLLAVPDSLYNRVGINSFDDLAAEFSTTNDVSNPEDSLYIYMEYHCLADGYYLTDLVPEKVYPSISNDSYVNIQVGADDFRINEDTLGNFSGFYVEESNIPAKNGVIHTINSVLPHTEARPAEVEFEVTDYLDLKREPCYGKYYTRFYDWNYFEGIYWEGEFLQYYYKEGQNLRNEDALRLSNHWSIEITTPKIMKGKYMLSSDWFGSSTEQPSMDWYVDGVLVDNVLFNESGWSFDPAEISVVEFKETKAHKIKVSTVVPGDIWWDYVTFTPIK